MSQEIENDFKSNKIKRLPPSVLKDIELKNHARRLAGLSPIKVKFELALLATPF